MNLADKNGMTALYQASAWGQAEVVRLLLEARAEVNLADKNDMTPLYVA